MILCRLDTTSLTSSHLMLLSQFIHSIETSSAFNTRHDSNSLRSSKKKVNWTYTNNCVNTHCQIGTYHVFSLNILKHDKLTLPHMLYSHRCTSCEKRCCHMFWCVEWMSCKYAQEYLVSIQWVPNKIDACLILRKYEDYDECAMPSQMVIWLVEWEIL